MRLVQWFVGNSDDFLNGRAPALRKLLTNLPPERPVLHLACGLRRLRHWGRFLILPRA